MNLTDAEILEALATWLPGRRWFAGKGHHITGLRMAARHSIPGVEGAEHLIVNVHLDEAVTQTYQVPVVVGRDAHRTGLIAQTSAGFLHDGMTHAAVIEGLLAWDGKRSEVGRTHDLLPALAYDESAAIENRDETTLESRGHHEVVAEAAQSHWVVPHPDTSNYRVLAVEQSNSSGVVGEATLVKLFRILIPGVNPDIELHAALRDAECADVGALHGWMSGGWHEPATDQIVYGHLAMMVEYFPDSVDGFTLACQSALAKNDFSEEAGQLGEATARVHRDLRRVFPTQIVDAAGMATMSRRLLERLTAAAHVVPQVASIREPLQVLLERLSGIGHAEVQRIHGDLHLGQVLRTASGWRIIDFEGEPGATLDHRNALDHPMRDLAGMVRSFAYAAWHGGHDGLLAEQWQHRCTVAFLEGYRRAGGLVDEELLSAYLVDKAAYEAVYETRNRPDWLGIPLRALRELAATHD